MAMSKSLEERVKAAVREEISISPYNPAWPVMFLEEAEFLRCSLPTELLGRIEHFGSTAVPGLAGKPIVDMLVEVTSLEETQRQIVPILESRGYDYFWRTDVDPPYAWFIKRDRVGKRTHHIHMVEFDSRIWDALYFRDYLKEFSDESQRYDELKRSLATRYPKDRVAYTKGKTEYIREVTERAKHYYATQERS